MSVRVLSWVLDNSEAPGNDRLVLIAIADEADDDGTNAYPSLERIARRARVNRRTTIRSVARLEERGDLVVARPESFGRGRHNRYGVVMGRPLDEVRSLLGIGDNLSAGKGDTPSAPAPEKVHIGDSQVSPDPLTLEGSPPSSATSTVDPSPDAASLCELLADLIERNGSKRPNVGETWLTAADRMLRLDGRDPEKAARLIRWCQDDSFWKANVLSMVTFREKYDRLRLRAEEERVKRLPAGRPVDSDRDRPSGVVEL